MSDLKVNEIKTDIIKNQAGTSVMTISSTGAISEPNRPCFHVTKSADQTLANATNTIITFDEITDGSNTGRTINKGGLYANNKFTVTSETTGIYVFYASVFFQATNSLSLHGWFLKNGSEQQQHVYANGGWGNENKWGTYFNTQIINLSSAGDYIELQMYGGVSSSGTTNINQNNPSNYQRTNMGGYLVG